MEKDIEAIIKVAEKVITQYGSHQPTLFVKGEQGGVFVNFPQFGPNNEDKVRQMANMGVMIACERNVGDLKYLIFVNEAWMNMLHEGKLNVQASNDPKCIEVLIITSLGVNTDKQEMLAYQMVRDKSGDLTELKKLSFPGEVEVVSPLFPAFLAGYNLITR